MANLPEDVPGCDEGLTWSENLYTISELVDVHDLPCLVKVAEGVYSTEDTESFSNGDLLKLHRCERLEKVVAYPIESGHTKKWALKNYKNISSPILIPLDYRKKARVLTIGGDTRYPDRPEFVRRHAELIELRKDFVQDEKFVTKEVHVALANMDQFQGHFVLDRIESEYKAFGTHRLDLEDTGKRQPAVDVSESQQAVKEPSSSQEEMETYKSHQAVVIIPHTSDALFQVATNRETSIYQSFISLNFRANLDTVSLGGLYMEVQGSKLSQTVESDFYEASGNSPPLLTPRQHSGGIPSPPRPPPRPSRRTSSDHPEQRSDHVNVTPISPPSVPSRSNRPKRQGNYLRPLPCTPGQNGNVSPTGKVSPSGMVSPTSKVSPLGKVSPSGKASYSGKLTYSKGLPQPRVHQKPIKTQPKPSQAVRPLGSGAQTTAGTPLATIDRKARKPTYLELVSDNAKPQKSKITDTKGQVSERQDSPLVGACGYSNPTGSDWGEKLKTLSVEQVRAALGTLGLRKKVEPFVEMEIDGGYLQALFRDKGDILKAEPFSLNLVEMLKLKMFVETGKLPIKK
ncbi:uncharacterized protein LOC135464866 [Liolophura sinensis]|uniref:uncharacterized protein LOC135464866 n=1 Tax=Liolophura sinensis TaxID=3198878 RepID=UPI0031581CF2